MRDLINEIYDVTPEEIKTEFHDRAVQVVLSLMKSHRQYLSKSEHSFDSIFSEGYQIPLVIARYRMKYKVLHNVFLYNKETKQVFMYSKLKTDEDKFSEKVEDLF